MNNSRITAQQLADSIILSDTRRDILKKQIKLILADYSASSTYDISENDIQMADYLSTRDLIIYFKDKAVI